MEQKVSKKSKRRMWSVIVTIHVTASERVKMGKFGYDRQKKYLVEYCHPSVTKFYKLGNRLHVVEGKMITTYDTDRIEMVQAREHKRMGVQ